MLFDMLPRLKWNYFYPIYFNSIQNLIILTCLQFSMSSVIVLIIKLPYTKVFMFCISEHTMTNNCAEFQEKLVAFVY